MLVAGLGNPGPKYAQTRHNVGFMVVDKLIKKLQAHPLSSSGFEGELFKTSTHFLLKPTTYMNLSGQSLRKVCNFYKIETEGIIVIHDDLDLPFGAIRFKRGGGHGGHNGLKSIDTHIAKEYVRVRIGIGKPAHKEDVASYVLSPFSEPEQKHLPALIEQAAKAVDELLSGAALEDVATKYTIKKPRF